MSVKIKIKWDDLNAISEGARIYKSASAFTSGSLPAVYATVAYGVEEFEDLDIVENQTYFYMLSCVLGEQEVFTGCFEIEAANVLWLNSTAFINYAENMSNSYHNYSVECSSNKFNFVFSGSNQYSSAVLAPNGKIYCIPADATDILIIDPASNTATRSTMGVDLSGSGKWYGGVLAPNGKIYCTPNNAVDILIIDPTSNTATRSNLGVNLSGASNWLSSTLGSDGKIYCAPYNATDILIIDPASNTATRSNMGANLSGGGNWNGMILGSNGNLYAIPGYSNNVLMIDVVTGVASRIGYPGFFVSGNGHVKGVLAPNGKIYCPPASADSVLIFNQNSAVPPVDAKFCLSPHINKF